MGRNHRLRKISVTVMWQHARRIHETLSYAAFWLGALALALIVPIYCYEIVMRYVFRTPSLWATDTVSFMLLFSTFLVIPWLTRNGGNVAVTMLPEMLPDWQGRLLLRGGFLFGAVICAWVAYITAAETVSLYQRASFTMTTIPLPRWIFGVAITYGIANCAIYFLMIALQVSLPPRE